MSTDNITESAWNPVKLGANSNKGYKISTYEMSSSWYNRQLENEGDRLMRLQRYHEMDISSVEIGRALDIMAEDISSCNADEEDPVELQYPEDAKILKSTLKMLENVKNLWIERTGMDTRLYDVARETLKFGATFYREQRDGSLKKLYPERMVGYILDPEDEDIVTHYIYDENIQKLTDRSRRTRSQNIKTVDKDKIETIPVSELLVFRIGDGAFGESVLERVYRTWRQMTLIEDAVIIYRVVRAPERRIYYIDVGNLQGPKREQAIEKQRMRLMQKQTNKKGQMDSEYDPHATSEDIFIPTNSTGKGSRVETLPGGQNLGQLEDLEYFARKLATGLRIPHSMIDVHGDQQQQHSDMRVGQLYQVEMRYMGYIRRFAIYFASVLTGAFEKFTRQREIELPRGTTLRIPPPMSFALYKDMELNQSMLNVYNATMQMEAMSRKYAFTKYLNMDHDELAQNEIDKLHEMGLDDEQIKSMTEAETSNLVYGDKRLGEKFGLPAPEQGMGRF